MDYKVDYELKKDSLGRKYALKIDLKTGKKQRVGYKLAQTRISGLKSSRKRAKIVNAIKETETGATYKEYREISPTIESEIKAKREKEGKPALSAGVMRGRVKKIAIEHRTGVATRMRYAWVYRVVVERYLDDEGEIHVECDTAIFKARGLKRNGDEFERMCSVCQDAYDRIKSLDLCSIDGGACVIFYNKSDKEVIKQFELGKGCGFSFDFTNYSHEDKDNNYDEGEYDWL